MPRTDTKVLKTFASTTKAVCVSLDCAILSQSNRLPISFPQGIPYQVLPGQRLVVTVTGIVLESDPSAYHKVDDFGKRAL